MGLIFASIENQRTATALATTISSNINFDFCAHNMHLDVYQLKNTTTASSILVAVQKLAQVRLNTINGTPESTIDGQDLFDFHPTAIGKSPYISVLTAVDNDPFGFTLFMPLSPYPDDPTENFGLPAQVGSNIEMQFIADAAANTFDNTTYDITAEGIDAATKPTPNGYLKFTRDAQTLAVGNDVFTRVYGRRLLGVFNFMTTSFDDLAAAAAIDVTTIRTQAVTFSRNPVYGPFRPQRSGAGLWLPQITAAPPIVLDNGSHFQNLGIQNRAGKLGVNIEGNTQVEIRTTGGAANAARIYPTILT